MDIIFSANNNEEIMVFPVVPPDTGPAVPQEHEDFEAITGKMKIIGNMGLRSLSIESFWPVDKNYPWVRPGSDPNGWLYVEFFEKVASQIGVSCRELVMVEDSIHSVLSAKQAGFSTIGVYEKSSADKWQEMQKHCDVCVENMAELMTIF